MGRSPCCDKTKVKRGPWSPEEDNILRNYIQNHGTGGNWIALPHKAGLKRCGKSCRLRWLNYLRPDIKLGGFTEEEDNIISSLYLNIGSRWSVIASHLQGRTDNDVKNRWNTKLKKKLPSSHKSTMITTNNSCSSNNTSINPPEFTSSVFLLKQEVNHYQNVQNPSLAFSTNYQQQYTVSSSNSDSFNDNVLSSRESQHSYPNAFPTGNYYASWCDNLGATDFDNDLLTGEFDFGQLLGEVALN